MNNHEIFSSFHFDVLKEAGNIGAGNAATALSKLVNKKIEMDVPDVRLHSFNEIMDLLGGPEQIVASVFLRFNGDISGDMFFVLPVDKATLFIKQLTQLDDVIFDNFSESELALSAYQEVGNILASSFLWALSDFIKLKCYPSVPEVSIDMFGAIISHGFLELSKYSDYAIVIETELRENPSDDEIEVLKGNLFILPDPEFFQKVYRALGVEE